ncbi:ribonuclease HII, partial [Salmonella enterica subsp. enterica serovar Kentucky]|nr:ribonuclease HII [Salmonella enterica subsp. enterica serovar Kentucky]
AAVILDPARPIVGLNDSKKLSEKRRLSLYDEIKEKALSWSLGKSKSTSAASKDSPSAKQRSASFALSATETFTPLPVSISAVIR